MGSPAERFESPNSLCGGGGALLLYFPENEHPHNEFLGSDPNWGFWGVFLYVYVLFFALDSWKIFSEPVIILVPTIIFSVRPVSGLQNCLC